MSSTKPKKKKGTRKRLFIISPIGQPDSEIRKFFDKVRRHIIDPIASEKGYKTSRADNISRPGRITKQIVERLLKDDLVIADLTRKNPNVFYELAVRHAVGKPVILMGAIGDDIPFDVAAQRVILYDLDPDNITGAKQELARQISSVESDTFIVDSPIESSIPLEPSRASDTEQERIYAILRNQSRQLQRIQGTLTERYSPTSSGRERENSRRLFFEVLGSLSVDEGFTFERAVYRSLAESAVGGFETTAIEYFKSRLKSVKKPVKVFYDIEALTLWYVDKNKFGVWRTGSADLY